MPRTSENTSSQCPAAVAARMATEDRRQLLGQCMPFRELGAEERNALFARVHIRGYCAGETIFHMGSAGDSMMAVLSGSVRISVPSRDGREIVLAILQPGEVLGEIALLDGKERTADATAVAGCHLAIIERRDMLAFLDRHPKIWPKVAEVLCGRLRSSDEHITELALHQLPTRLAKALLRFASMKQEATSWRLQVPLSQSELGNICGARRESVNKCLSTWQRRGIVHIDEGVLTIANRAALDELAELEPCRRRKTAGRRQQVNGNLLPYWSPTTVWTDAH